MDSWGSGFAGVVAIALFHYVLLLNEIGAVRRTSVASQGRCVGRRHVTARKSK